MKTHKIKVAGWDSYLGNYDGTFRTFCGIVNTDNEDLFENCLVGEHDDCTCKVCNKAYKKKMERIDEIIKENKKYEEC